jgi:putative heme degradation protein
MQLYVKDSIDFDAYRAMKKQVEDDRATAQAEIARIDVPEEKEPEIKKEEIVADLKQNWDAMTNGERRQFLVRYIKAIYAVNEVPEGKVHGTVKITAVEFRPCLKNKNSCATSTK